MANRSSLWVVVEMRLGLTSLAQSRDGSIIVDEGTPWLLMQGWLLEAEKECHHYYTWSTP